LAAKPGYDGVFQAMSGMMSATGHPDGHEGGGPMKIGLSMSDILTSLYAANAIQAALYHRDVQGGPGQHIDLALLDCSLASLSHFAMNYLVSGEVPPRRGNGGYGGVPSQAFNCADRAIFLVAGNNPQFARLCHAIGRPELLQDTRFSETSCRIQNRDALLVALDAVFVTRTADVWLKLLDDAGVAAGPVNDLPRAMAMPQVVEREMVREIEHPLAGRLRILSNPIRLSETPITRYDPPPVVGQDTDTILNALGYDDIARAALRSAGAI
jgi:crotonobetainyl-CoA:carnitine CoA-transferase CaiB-like acyl-CoA transferase